MKKIFVAMALLLAVVLTMVGCGNRKVFDTVWSYEYAIITLPTGEIIEGKVESWSDYEDSDMIQIKIDGMNYFTHSSNVVMFSDDD